MWIFYYLLISCQSRMGFPCLYRVRQLYWHPSTQKFLPFKNDSKWHKMAFWVIFGGWKILMWGLSILLTHPNHLMKKFHPISMPHTIISFRVFSVLCRYRWCIKMNFWHFSTAMCRLGFKFPWKNATSRI